MTDTFVLSVPIICRWVLKQTMSVFFVYCCLDWGKNTFEKIFGLVNGGKTKIPIVKCKRPFKIFSQTLYTLFWSSLLSHFELIFNCVFISICWIRKNDTWFRKTWVWHTFFWLLVLNENLWLGLYCLCYFWIIVTSIIWVFAAYLYLSIGSSGPTAN